MKDKLIKALGELKNQFRDEAELQQATEAILRQETYAREYPLDEQSRIDFLVLDLANQKRIGIECKVKPNGMAVWRQLSRYAEHVDVLILLTTAPVQKVMEPTRQDGKKIEFHLIELWKNL